MDFEELRRLAVAAADKPVTYDNHGLPGVGEQFDSPEMETLLGYIAEHPELIVELVDRIRAGNVPLCSICHGTGWNHGNQVTPSKAHPTGYKTIRCDCAKNEDKP